MKNLFIALALLIGVPAFAQFGSGTGSFGSVGGGGITSAQAAAQIGASNLVQNFSSGSQVQNLTISNGTYGTLYINLNRPSGAVGTEIQTFGGDYSISPQQGSGFNLGPPSQFYDWTGSLDPYWFTLGSPNEGGTYAQFHNFDYPSTVVAGKWNTGMPISSYSPYPGGSASTLDDLPDVKDGMAALMSAPPIVVTTWSSVQTAMNQAALTNYIYQATTNGYFAALTNAGVIPWLHLDSNASPLTNSRTAAGLLAIDTSAFPDGANFLYRFHTNGWKVAMTIYGVNMPTNSVNTTWNGTAGSGADTFPAMTPNTIRTDVNTFYGWNLNAIRFSDTGLGGPGALTPGYFNLFSLGVANAILTPTVNGQNFNRPYYQAYTLGYTNNPLASWMITTEIGGIQPQLFDRVNCICGHDQPTSPIYLPSATGFVHVMNNMRAQIYYECPYQHAGSFGSGTTIFTDTTTNIIQGMLSDAAMTCGIINVGWPASSSFSATLTNTLAAITNALFLNIQKDALGIPAKPIFDNGASNTSAWYRPLTGGGFAVYLVNETSSSTNFSIGLTQLGAPGSSYTESIVWGVATNQFSGSYTVPALSGVLVKIMPSVGSTFANVDIPTNTLGTHGYSGYFNGGIFISTGTY